MPKTKKTVHLIPVSGKKCTTCRRNKGSHLFGKCRTQLDGLDIYCKSCKRKIRRKWYCENKDKSAQYSAKWKRENPDKYKEMRKASHKRRARKERQWVVNNRQKCRDKVKRYKLKNPPDDKMREKDRLRYAANPSKKIAAASRWQKKYPEKKRAINHKRRVIIRGGSGSYTDKEWEAKKAEFSHTCPRCGKKEPDIKLTVDHAVPVTKGGSNSIDNIQPLCGSCNTSKGAKTVIYKPRQK